MSCATDRARILVLGDSGVGKTSLVHLIAHGKPLSQISYTVGAAVEVKLHEYREGTASQKTYWIGKDNPDNHKFGNGEEIGKLLPHANIKPLQLLHN